MTKNHIILGVAAMALLLVGVAFAVNGSNGKHTGNCCSKIEAGKMTACPTGKAATTTCCSGCSDVSTCCCGDACACCDGCKTGNCTCEDCKCCDCCKV